MNASQALSELRKGNREMIPTLEELAKAADSRSALVEGGVVTELTALLQTMTSAAKGSCSSESVESLSAALGALSAFCCQEGIAKQQALEAVPNITACMSLEGASNEGAVANALKAMANLTQGETKEHPSLLEAVPTLVGMAMSEDGHMAAYAAIALTNLANGSDKLKQHLVRCGTGAAIVSLLRGQGKLCMHGLRLLLPICYGPQEANVMTAEMAESVCGIVMSDAGSEHRLSAKAGLRVIMNATIGDARGSVLIGSGADRILGSVLEDEPHEWSSEDKIMCAKALCHMARGQWGAGLAVSATRGLVAALRVEGQLQMLAIRALASMSEHEGSREVMSVRGAPEALVSFLDQGCGGGEGAGRAAQVAANLASTQKGIEAFGELSLGLHMARVSMTEGGKGQLAALKTIVLLSRVGEAAKKGLLKREVVTCLNSTVKAESGEAQVHAVKALCYLTRWHGSHETLIGYGCVPPLLETIDVTSGQPRVYSLQAIRNLTAGSPETRVCLVKGNLLSAVVKCGAGGGAGWVEGEKDGCIAMSLECIKNVAKDTGLATDIVKAGALPLIITTLSDQSSTPSCLRDSLIILQRLSTNNKAQHFLSTSGLLPLLTTIITSPSSGSSARQLKLIAAMAVAPLMVIDDKLGTSAAPLASTPMPPHVYQDICSALSLSLSVDPNTNRRSPTKPLNPEASPSSADPSSSQPLVVYFQTYEVVVAIRHLCFHATHKQQLASFDAASLLAAVVRDRDQDTTLAALASQALLDCIGPPPPHRRANEKAHGASKQILGEDYFGRLGLCARRLRPTSPDQSDMLLVM